MASLILPLHWKIRNTIKPGTPKHGTTEHGILTEQRNTGVTAEH